MPSLQGSGRAVVVQTIVRLVLVLLLAATLCRGADAQTRRTTAPPSGQVDVSELPISVDRIREDLEKPPALDLEVTEPLFRVEIVAPRPPDWLENIDWLGTRDHIGPSVQIPSLHDQYLARVTPREVQPFSSFAYTGPELLQVAVTSFLQGLATRKIAEEVPDRLRAHREERARREVDAAIERWQRMVEEQRASR